MENNIKSVSTDLFYKIRNRFSGLKLGTATGEVTINPEEAVFFDFDYMEGENAIGHISISLAETGSMKVYYSTGITETMSSTQKTGWYDFLKNLREFSKRRLMNFDTRDIAKDNLDKRDYAFLSQYSNQNNSGDNTMSEGMYGSTKTSYQKLNDTKLIIKHKKQVDETVPGSRARNISALFIENQNGERFKYPFIHLAGARAMQRHVANGGVPYDNVGQYIVSMSEHIAQLKSFGNYVVRNDLLNSETNNIVERSSSELSRIKEEIHKLSKQQYYEQFKEAFSQQPEEEIPQGVIEELTNKFTVRNFNEEMKAVFPLIYKLMKEQESTNIGYDDIVAITSNDETTNEDIEIETETDSGSDFDKFESWVMGLGETSAIQSADEDEKQTAIRSLGELIGQHFPAGVDGTNAIESLTGIIEDPKLDAEIKNVSKEDSETCVRPLIKSWLEQNAPDVVDELDFGDMDEADMEDPMAYANDAADADAEEYHSREGIEDTTESDDDMYGAKKSDIPAYMRKAKGDDDWKLTQKDLDKESERNISSKEWLRKKSDESLNIKEVAEFISSFYDREAGTFPKGPEGVCTMVGKKFGEQAEQVARKFVERMAPQQTASGTQELSDGTNEGWGSDEYHLFQNGYTIHQKRQSAGPGESGFLLYKTPGAKTQQDAEEMIQGQEPIKAFPSLNMALDAMKGMDQGSKESMELEAIRRLSGMPDIGVAEESSSYYHERLAQEVFDQNPDLDTSGRDPEVLDAVFPLLVRDLGSKKRANNLLNYDEDFPSDFVSAYGELQRNRSKKGSDTISNMFGGSADELTKGLKIQDDVNPELESIKRLSGISQGLGY